MPRTVYELRHPNHETQPSYVPERWAYIGETVQSRVGGELKKVPVFNRVSNSWWQLNSGVDAADFVLRDITYHSALLDITNETSPDFGEYRLTVTPDGTEITLPDGTDTYLIDGLSPLTQYTVELKAWIITDPATSDPDAGTGGYWGSTVQTFTTLDNPVPTAPSMLTPHHTNTYVDLKWSDSPNSSAVSYNIYKAVENQPLVKIKNVTGKTGRLLLSKDTKYRYAVAGVNADNLEGPKSNIIRWATGHDTEYRQGSMHREVLKVHEFGSWRPDIGWNDWHYWPNRVRQDSIFQGFWTNDYRRYRGCITYREGEFRHHLNRKFGLSVWRNLHVTRAEIGRVYRMRLPGNAASQHMLWHLTRVNVFDSSGPPPSFYQHRNNRNNADALAGQDRLKAGAYHNNLRIPRWWGNALVKGVGNGTEVNGLMLYRGDQENNGYGTAGYMECSGHLQRDRHLSDSWRYSNWNLYISANWKFQSRAYQAPYRW